MPSKFLTEFMKKKNAYLFILPVVLPLLLVLFAYLKANWSWGLMDDSQDLTLTSHGNFSSQVKEFTAQGISSGRLRWTYGIYIALFYKLFAGMPKIFYIFKWLEITGMLFIWGALSYQLTKKRESFFIMPVVALSFRFLYPQFFGIAFQETNELFFLGLACLAVVHAEFPPDNKKFSLSARIWSWSLAVIALILSVGAKETGVSAIMALGIAVLWLGLTRRLSKGTALLGAGLIVCALIYGWYLKFVISGGSTAAYSLSNHSTIVTNLILWIKDPVRHHIPWIILAAWMFWRTVGVPAWSSFSQEEQFALILGSTFYILRLGVLLPWHTNGYYAANFGVYFAFLFTVMTSKTFEKLKDETVSAVMVFVLIFNLYILQNELYIGRTMNTDVQNLWHYIKGNDAFQNDDRRGLVFCNMFEASQSIPRLANRLDGLRLEDFGNASDFSDAKKKGATYYVAYYELIKEDPLKEGWQVEFYSNFWRVYRIKS